MKPLQSLFSLVSRRVRYSRLRPSRVTRARLLFPRGFSSKRETAHSLVVKENILQIVSSSERNRKKQVESHFPRSLSCEASVSVEFSALKSRFSYFLEPGIYSMVECHVCIRYMSSCTAVQLYSCTAVSRKVVDLKSMMGCGCSLLHIVKFTSFQRDGRRCYEYLFACVKRNKMFFKIY